MGGGRGEERGGSKGGQVAHGGGAKVGWEALRGHACQRSVGCNVTSLFNARTRANQPHRTQRPLRACFVMRACVAVRVRRRHAFLAAAAATAMSAGLSAALAPACCRCRCGACCTCPCTLQALRASTSQWAPKWPAPLCGSRASGICYRPQRCLVIQDVTVHIIQNSSYKTLRCEHIKPTAQVSIPYEYVIGPHAGRPASPSDPPTPSLPHFAAAVSVASR